MLVNELKDFLNSADYSRWIGNKRVKVYVRKSVRYLNRTQYLCLDLANIEVAPKYQRQGIFKKVLQTWRTYNPYPVVFIENVLNEHLYEWLIQQPYIQQCPQNLLCFYILDKQDDTQSTHS